MPQVGDISDWDEAKDGPLTIEAVRRLFTPPERYRISEYRYPQGTKFNGNMRPGIVYTLEGECEYRFPSAAVHLRCGQYAKLPGGDYEVEALGSGELVVVLAWQVPFETTQ